MKKRRVHIEVKIMKMKRSDKREFVKKKEREKKDEGKRRWKQL